MSTTATTHVLKYLDHMRFNCELCETNWYSSLLSLLLIKIKSNVLNVICLKSIECDAIGSKTAATLRVVVIKRNPDENSKAL